MNLFRYSRNMPTSMHPAKAHTCGAPVLLSAARGERSSKPGPAEQIGPIGAKRPGHLHNGVEGWAAQSPLQFAHVGQRKVGPFRQCQLANAFLGSQFSDGLPEMDRAFARVSWHSPILATATTIDYKP